MFNNSIERLSIGAGDIHLVVYRPKPYSNNRKTIIHYHGYGSDVARYEHMAQLFALHGYQFVMPEMESHGVRGCVEDPYDYTGVMDIMIQTFAEYWDIKDLILNRLNGDIKNIAISGHSMGAMIASSIIARDKDIAFAILYNGLADYDMLDEISENLSEKVDPIEREEFMKFNPTNFLESFHGRHALILIGDKDEIVKPKIMASFKQKLIDNYINIDNMHFINYDDAAHSIAYKMLDNALNYTNERMKSR